MCTEDGGKGRWDCGGVQGAPGSCMRIVASHRIGIMGIVSSAYSRNLLSYRGCEGLCGVPGRLEMRLLLDTDMDTGYCQSTKELLTTHGTVHGANDCVFDCSSLS